ncbi:hypothetical protein [Noviherbaspirillum sp.]|uniref:hypothetical protein n=1 Tax=Noviherbaspirillum sp. TaxID=1926288 RepID=UPI002FE1BE2F
MNILENDPLRGLTGTQLNALVREKVDHLNANFGRLTYAERAVLLEELELMSARAQRAYRLEELHKENIKDPDLVLSGVEVKKDDFFNATEDQRGKTLQAVKDSIAQALEWLERHKERIGTELYLKVSQGVKDVDQEINGHQSSSQ